MYFWNCWGFLFRLLENVKVNGVNPILSLWHIIQDSYFLNHVNNPCNKCIIMWCNHNHTITTDYNLSVIYLDKKNIWIRITITNFSVRYDRRVLQWTLDGVQSLVLVSIVLQLPHAYVHRDASVWVCLYDERVGSLSCIYTA